MFYDQDCLVFNILGVFSSNQKHVNVMNTNRNYAAISYRFRADATLETKTQTHHVTDNYVAYVPPRVNYRRTSSVDEMVVVNLEVQNYMAKEIEVFEADSSGILANLFLDILNCWTKKEIGYRYKCSAILSEILAECHIQNFRAQLPNTKIQASVDYIKKHFHDKQLPMADIARHSFISEVYFRRLFKEAYGISPKKYIIQLRIQYALNLISTQYYSLTEISNLCGYNDYKHFATEFKKIMGTSPSEYVYNGYHQSK